MKKNNSKRLNFLKSAGLFFLLTLGISNCKEKIEGCLDIEAENFDFSADIPCPDNCCEYPSLTFQISFRWDSLSLVYGNPYNFGDKVLKITKTKFYISDISLTNETETFRITDRIELTVNDGSSGIVNFVDDFALLSRDFTSFNYEIGEIRGSGTFDTLRFTVGLVDQANKVEPTSAPSGHPLAIQSDSMWSVENRYVFNKLIMVPDTIPPVDTLAFNVSGDLNLVKIVLPFKVNLAVGYDLTVPIEVDYSKWFEGIDFEADSTQVVSKIVEKTAQAFSINE